MFRYEVTSRKKGSLLWALSFVFMIVAGMNKFITMADQGDANLARLMETLPKAIRVMYGMEGYDLSSSLGYSALMLFFILIMVAFHGIYLGTGLLGREIQEKTVDFIFVKPWSRMRILTQKVLAAVAIVILMQLVIGFSFYSQMKNLEAMSIFWKIMAASIVTHFFFLFLGVLLSVLLHQRENAQKIALSLTLLSYLLVVFGQLYEVPGIEKGSPIGFFPKSLEGTSFYVGLGLTLGLALLFLLLGLGKIKKKQFAM